MFDTLTYAQELKEAGFTEAQATAQAKAFLSIAEDKLVNKQDLALLKTELMAKIDQQGQELTAKIDQQGQELTAKIDQQGQELTTKIDQQGQELAAKIDTKIGGLLKWLIVALIGQTGLVISVIALLNN